MTLLIYTMNRRGATWGKVSGRFLQFEDGDEMTLPEGELDHLRGGTYQTRPHVPRTGTTPSEGPEPLPLPEECPHYDKLTSAGVSTLSALDARIEAENGDGTSPGLTDISGIGVVSAAAIVAWRTDFDF